jgi:DNA topoisomerase I
LKTYANVSSIDDVFEIGLNRAVSLIAEKRTRGPRRGAEALRVLGEHPESGNPVEVFAGKYGPYVKCDGVNATLPKEIAPEAVTLAQALELIAAKGPAKVKKGAAKKPAAKKPAAKKAAAKKPVAKKPSAKKPTAKKTAPKG